MTYWDLIIGEVLNKKRNADKSFYFVPKEIGQTNGGGAGGGDRINKKKKRQSTKKTCSLGPKFPGIYLTLQEARCMNEALKGKTFDKIGATLELSPRTVEYYFEKIRRKLNCKNKAELLEKISESDFLTNYNAISE